MSITPITCIDCRLCENSCPFGAINKPVPVKSAENREISVRRLILFTVLTPLFVFLGGFAGSKLHDGLAGVNPKVRLAKVLTLSEDKRSPDQQVDVTSFRSSGTTMENLQAEVNSIIRQFNRGGWLLGGFIGLVFGLTLAGLSIPRYRTGYWPNKGTCLSCARCMEYCPVKEGMNDDQINALRKTGEL